MDVTCLRLVGVVQRLRGKSRVQFEAVFEEKRNIYYWVVPGYG